MVAERGPVLDLRVSQENVQQGGRDAAIAVAHAEARTFPRSPLKTCQGKNEEKTGMSDTTSEAIHKDQPCVSISL